MLDLDLEKLKQLDQLLDDCIRELVKASFTVKTELALQKARRLFCAVRPPPGKFSEMLDFPN